LLKPAKFHNKATLNASGQPDNQEPLNDGKNIDCVLSKSNSDGLIDRPVILDDELQYIYAEAEISKRIDKSLIISVADQNSTIRLSKKVDFDRLFEHACFGAESFAHKVFSQGQTPGMHNDNEPETSVAPVFSSPCLHPSKKE
jgi:hypothetical protein